MKLKILKISTFICVIAISAAISSFGVIARAEDGMPTSGNIDAGGKVRLKEQLRIRAGEAGAQLEKNSAMRNVVLEDRNGMQTNRKDGGPQGIKTDFNASGGMPGSGLIRPGFGMNQDASSSVMFRQMKGERKEILKTMHADIFGIRKNALVQELTTAINNLTLIRERINNAIIKFEGQGRTLTEARADLVIADAKLAKAKVAVDALAAFNYSTTTTNGTISETTGTPTSGTGDIGLEKPRKIGDEAIKAVKDAREALRNVVAAIAHAMGFGNENGTSTTTPTGTGTTTLITN